MHQNPILIIKAPRLPPPPPFSAFRSALSADSLVEIVLRSRVDPYATCWN